MEGCGVGRSPGVKVGLSTGGGVGAGCSDGFGVVGREGCAVGFSIGLIVGAVGAVTGEEVGEVWFRVEWAEGTIAAVQDVDPAGQVSPTAQAVQDVAAACEERTSEGVKHTHLVYCAPLFVVAMWGMVKPYRGRVGVWRTCLTRTPNTGLKFSPSAAIATPHRQGDQNTRQKFHRITYIPDSNRTVVKRWRDRKRIQFTVGS
jgi:hypothetical protein